MINVTPATYLMEVIPQFAMIFIVQAELIFGQIQWRYAVKWWLLAILFSLAFSTIGEIIFAAIYILSLLKRHEAPLIISFLLLIDGYIFYRNLVTLPRLIKLPFSTPQLEIADGISTILINLIVIAAILYAVHHFDRQLQTLKQTLYTDPSSRRVFVGYSLLTCASLYTADTIADLMAVSFDFQAITLGILLLLIASNLAAFFFLNHALQASNQIKLLQAAETARTKYYADLEAQQAHTQKILHDYKNVLATLQVSLDADHDATQTREVLTQAQHTLNEIQPNRSALSAVATLPLRSLLYLKWTQAANQQIKLNIQTSGTANIQNNDDLLATLRIVGILLDNAIEATATHGEVDVLLIESPQALAITVINSVPKDFDLSRLSQAGYTTKGVGHGLGWGNIRTLTRRDHHLKLMKRVIRGKLSITLVIEVA
ncbi:GHKL domain-containing protein [Lacticaseibacillus porcinae]|uniref:GHKL domain-containing protein n=1 Tax=Lacticaseibacillus porcinae TaxID=1123687 RepID=UPI000F7A270F|nr:GHKL domain-containing protein [Lacticaseibacillus porcinae]